MDVFFNWEIIVKGLPGYFTEGLVNTIRLSLLSSLVGTVMGIIISLMSQSKLAILRVVAAVYTNIMRALPAMLTIYIIGQGLPLAHVKIFGNNTYGYAALAIGMMEASYLAEIFRSGMQSVNRTYVESGISFGLPSRRIFSSIIIPIGVRCIIPALVNQYILIVKASSLVYLLGLPVGSGDLYSMARNDVSITGSLAPLVAAGFIYLLLMLPLTWLVEHLNKVLNRRTEGGSRRRGLSDSELATEEV